MAVTTLITVGPNKFNFVKDLYYGNQEKFNKFKEDVLPYFDIITIDFSIMMDKITEIIELNPTLLGHSPVIYETATNIYQVCYVDSKDNSNINKDTDVNIIGSCLIGEEIYGKAVVVNSMITAEKTCEPDTMTLDNIVDILYSKFVHKGIHISASQVVTEFTYLCHPIEYYNISNQSDYDNYKIINVDLLDFELCVVVEINPKNKVVNKRATRLVGTEIVYSEVLIISKGTHEYFDLNLQVYEKLNELSYGDISMRSADYKSEKEASDMVEKMDNKNSIENKYVGLERAYNNKQKKCDYCGNTLDEEGVLTCTGCYRVRYDSVECQKAAWSSHKKDCLFVGKN